MAPPPLMRQADNQSRERKMKDPRTYKVELEIRANSDVTVNRIAEQVAVVVADLFGSAWGKRFMREARVKSIVEK